MTRHCLLSRRLAGLALLLSAAAGCNATTAPEDADSRITPAVLITSTFAGTLSQNGSQFYSFVVTHQGPVSLTLAAVQTPGGGALAIPVGVGVGIPRGTGCARSQSVATPPGLAAQISVTLNPGTYCASVFDTGALTGTVNFAMRITYPQS